MTPTNKMSRIKGVETEKSLFGQCVAKVRENLTIPLTATLIGMTACAPTTVQRAEVGNPQLSQKPDLETSKKETRIEEIVNPEAARLLELRILCNAIDAVPDILKTADSECGRGSTEDKRKWEDLKEHTAMFREYVLESCGSIESLTSRNRQRLMKIGCSPAMPTEAEDIAGVPRFHGGRWNCPTGVTHSLKEAVLKKRALAMDEMEIKKLEPYFKLLRKSRFDNDSSSMDDDEYLALSAILSDK